MAGPAAAEAESLLDSLPSLSDGPVLVQSSSLSKKDQQSSLFLNSRSSASPGDGTQGPAKSTPMSSISQWAKGLRTPLSSSQQSSSGAESTKTSSFSFVAGGFGKRTPAKIPVVEAPDESTSSNAVVQEGNAFGTFTKGFLDSSRNAVKAVQLKARHLVSQNKRRYQVIPFLLCI
jgi:phosphatidylinositol-3,4,5-trisphosphate 3-phosphatase/dual-specificity protein phosphatase PTEN